MRKQKTRPLTEKELGELRLEVTEKGFSLWSKENTWILDASLIFREGQISYCNRNNEVQVEFPKEKDEFGHNQILLRMPIKKKAK